MCFIRPIIFRFLLDENRQFLKVSHTLPPNLSVAADRSHSRHHLTRHTPPVRGSRCEETPQQNWPASGVFQEKSPIAVIAYKVGGEQWSFYRPETEQQESPPPLAKGFGD